MLAALIQILLSTKKYFACQLNANQNKDNVYLFVLNL